MEDYHAVATTDSVASSAAESRNALGNALGAFALIASLVLSLGGGVEIARADPPQAARDGLIWQNGQPIGTSAPPAAPAEIRSKAAKDASPKVAQTGPAAKGTPSPKVLVLNTRGYNYPTD